MAHIRGKFVQNYKKHNFQYTYLNIYKLIKLKHRSQFGASKKYKFHLIQKNFHNKGYK